MSIARILNQFCLILALAGAAAAQPANNTCGQNQAAHTIPGTGGSVAGTLLNATSDAGSSSCATTNIDVYYYFTPAVSGPYEFSTCASSMNINTVLSIHTACPATSANLVGAQSCNDNDPACGNRSRFVSPSLPAGGQVIVRVARGMGGGGGGGATEFMLSVAPIPVGACCDALLGGCQVQTEAACTGAFQGTGTICFPNPCPPAGACCGSMTGQCLVRTQTGCGADDWRGAGSACSPNPCPRFGACCGGKGGCAVRSFDECSARGGEYAGDGTTCTAPLCPPLGACCLSGGCELLTEPYCLAADGVFGQPGSTCAAAVCAIGACCVDACCRTTIQSLCTGTWHAGAACSAGGPCPLMASSDPCAPGVLPLGTPICGDNSASTGAGYIAPCGDTAVAVLSHMVYYQFVAPLAGNYSFSTCDSIHQFDTVLAIFDGNCTNATVLACSDDACGVAALQSRVSAVPLATGQQVLVIVAAYGSNRPGGAFRLLATADTPAGACCNAGDCTLSLPGACISPAIYQGDNTTCSPSPCIGACCLPSACAPITTDQASCPGIWTPCTIDCACTTTPSNDGCSGASALTPGVTIQSANCGATPDISGCQASPLPYSVWYTFVPPVNEFYMFDLCGSSVQPSIMMLTGACPGSNYDCGGGSAEPGAPCPDRASLIVGAPLAAGVAYSLVVWSPGAIGTPTGPGDFAITVNAAPRGACCCGATCSLAAANACSGPGSRFVGAGTACNLSGATSPCCPADFNQSLMISVQDIFDYLSAYFAGSGCTDINRSGTTSVQDIFDFLAAYFAGCE